MARHKNVEELEYPTKVTFKRALKGLWQISKTDMFFHGLMAILLITGLMMDLLGAFLGELLLPVRRHIHGGIGAIFVIVFPVYVAKMVRSKKMRLLLTAVNLIDFALYLLLIVSGIAITSDDETWAKLFPWLGTALASFQLASKIHAVTVYAWLLISIIFPGGFLHGAGTAYLIWLQRKREKKQG